MEIMAKAVDALIFFTYYPLTDTTFFKAMVELREKIRKPLFIVPGYATRQSKGMSQYIQKGVPALPTPERAARAISALRQYARYLEEHKKA
jgi:acyl-CoA synthetase (NDP forming)